MAVAILGVIGVSLLNTLDANAKATRTLDEEVTATNLATTYIEAIKALPYYTTAQAYRTDVTLQNITVPPQYIVNVGLDFSNDGDTTDGQITWIDEEYYNPETNPETIQKITIIISREGGSHILTVCTFKTKGVGG